MEIITRQKSKCLVKTASLFVMMMCMFSCQQKEAKLANQLSSKEIEKIRADYKEEEAKRKAPRLPLSDSLVTRNYGGGDLGVSVEVYYLNHKVKKIHEFGGTGDYGDFRNIFYFSDGKFCTSHLYSRESMYIRGKHRDYFMEAMYNFVDSTFQYKYDSIPIDSFIALPFDTISPPYDSVKTAQERMINQLLYESHSKGEFSYVFKEIDSSYYEGFFDLEVQPFYSDYTENLFVKEKDSFIDSLLLGLIQSGDTIKVKWIEEELADEEFPIKRYKPKN